MSRGIFEHKCSIKNTAICKYFCGIKGLDTCTAPMKALFDRHFGLNKFYGDAQGSLWEGKKVAIIATALGRL